MADPADIAAGLQAYDPSGGATMRAYDPTWRDRIASMLMGNTQASPERRNFVSGLMGSTGLGNTGMGLADLTPAGGVLGAQEAARNGDYKGAAINAMFLGPAARTADHVALATAQRMAQSGADRAAIHAETGWFTGADGKWRFEVPDNNLAPSRVAERDGFMLGNEQASDVVNHPALFDAYPSLQSMPVSEVPRQGVSAVYHQNPSRIGVTPDALRASDYPMLHELQHAIQTREGFARGGSQTEDGYRQLAGEVEARNVGARMNMTPEQRRATPPWQTQDVPDTMQIVRGLLGQ